MSKLLKNSPLSSIYQNLGAHCLEVAGWKIAEHCGQPQKEKEHLQQGALLVDWSHIGKISVRGESAAISVDQIFDQASAISPLHYQSTKDLVCLRLVMDEYLLLCNAGEEQKYLNKLDANIATRQTGAMACLVLAGKEKQKVWQHSSAMNFTEDFFLPGMALSTTIHRVRCTVYRTKFFDVLLHNRNFSEFLFTALMDVGKNVGLIAAGIASIPVSFTEEKS